MLFFKALSDLLISVAYCFNVKDSLFSDKLILYLYYWFTCGENLMSFLCLWFVVRIDLLDVNGDVGGFRWRWWATCLLSQGFYFSFIISCKCVVVSLKSYLDSIYSHRFNIIYSKKLLLIIFFPKLLNQTCIQNLS